jgi:hypothetical protein
MRREDLRPPERPAGNTHPASCGKPFSMEVEMKNKIILAAAFAALALLVGGGATAGTARVELVNVATNLRADVMWASPQDGQGVFLWRNNTSASQEFDLIPMGGGYFQIRARHSGKCLRFEDVPVYRNGTRIAQFPCPGPSRLSAQWSFVDMDPPCADNALCIDIGWRVVKNRYTGKCIDTANPSGKRPPEQAVLQQWTCITSTRAWNADNQIWKLVDPLTRKTVLPG